MTQPGAPTKEALGRAIAQKQAVEAPDLPYRPQDPDDFRPEIGVIGCGGVTVEHLTAYRNAGYNVVALCDIRKSRAEQRQREFFPDAQVYDNADALLKRDDISIVDITTHPAERVSLIEAAISAKKHILSQKPFVEDVDVGQHLCDLADQHDVLLAVNQNGRWAPHYSYIRQAVAAGLLGDLTAAHLAVHWDHGWVNGSRFEEIRHLILYDFGIHWFDLLTCLFANQRSVRVFASTAKTRHQDVRPALLAQALIEFESGQASLVFDGDTRFCSLDTTYVTGSRGTLTSSGPDLRQQTVTITTARGTASPVLDGVWFPDGFHGAMAELCSAIAQKRTPTHNARDNLRSLELCFAAVASAEQHTPVVPGTVRRLPDAAVQPP